MQNEGVLPCLWEQAVTKPEEFCPHPHTVFLIHHMLDIILPTMPNFQIRLFFRVFQRKSSSLSLMHSTYPVQQILLYLYVLLKLGEKYKL